MVAQAKGGCFLFDFEMRLEGQRYGIDIIYVAPENEHRVLENHLDGSAELVIEIVSPNREAVGKFKEYERGGVREFWLLDPHRREALFYVRDEGGLFRAGAIQNGEYQSQMLPTVKLRIEWLWEQPPIMEILRGWNLI